MVAEPVFAASHFAEMYGTCVGVSHHGEPADVESYRSLGVLKAQLPGLSGDLLIDQGKAAGDSVGLYIIAESFLELGDESLKFRPPVRCRYADVGSCGVLKEQADTPSDCGRSEFFVAEPGGKPVAGVERLSLL